MDGGITPVRATPSSSAAALFVSPSSPLPRRPVATPNSTASSHLRDFSSPPTSQTQRRPPSQQLHTSLTPSPGQTSADRYVRASTRQGTSMAHFLLTSTSGTAPQLIQAARRLQLSRQSPYRAHSLPVGGMEDLYPSPTRHASEREVAARGGRTSPRPRLTAALAKMHLDLTSRPSRGRSLSGASAMADTAGGGGGSVARGGSTMRSGTAEEEGVNASIVDGSAGGGTSPGSFTMGESMMEMEPYSARLARTLFSDAAQTTVLCVNDTSQAPSALHASPQAPDTPRSPDIEDPSARLFGDIDMDEEGVDEYKENCNCWHGGGGGTATMREDEEEGSNENEERKVPFFNATARSDPMEWSDRPESVHRRLAFPPPPTSSLSAALSSAPSTAARAFPRAPLRTANVNVQGMSEAERYETSLGVVFQCNRARNFTSPSFRVIPHTPERILDAADMEDDFYMNLIDWSAASDVLCVALQNCVYLWDAKTCDIKELPRMVTGHGGESRSAGAQLVCGLNWAPDGRHLAVGRGSGVVEVWDVDAQQMVQTYRQHQDRVVSLAWEPQSGSLLASGSRDSTIILRDVRMRSGSAADDFSSTSQASAIGVLGAHETEVCGLKWSPTGAMLASGGNDNQLLLWDRRCVAGNSTGSFSSSGGSFYRNENRISFASDGPQPLFRLNQHSAAVKALAWNPAVPNLLVSGGGSHDKSLRFWNALTGECLHHIHTGSQVCGVVWNRTGTEFVTAHGYTENQLSIWRYPSLRRTANLIGHTSRVLHLALSADGETVVSAAGDETLRFWRCFPSAYGDGGGGGPGQRESSPQLHRSLYSSSGTASTGGSPYGSPGFGGGSMAASSSSLARTRAAEVVAGRCGSASQDRDRLSYLNEEVELR